MRLGPTAIVREQGRRLVTVQFRVRGPDATGLSEVCKRVDPLIKGPYRAEWTSARSGN